MIFSLLVLYNVFVVRHNLREQSPNVGTSTLHHNTVGAGAVQTASYSYIETIEHLCGPLCQVGGNFDDGPYFQHRTIQKMDCDAYFKKEVMYLDGHGQKQAPQMIPNEWKDAFTIGGAVPVSERYIDENYVQADKAISTTTNLGNQVLRWDQSYVDSMVVAASKAELKGNYGRDETNSLREALHVAKDQILGGRVLVVGSENPWVEACVLDAGAASVVTLEFAPIVTDHPQIEALTPFEYHERYVDGTLGLFDTIVSFSSLEHSGLGRYGDALNPWGDILEVARTWCVTKDGGSLLIGVMYGNDEIEFNAHRRYGDLRWPFLTTNWHQEWRADKANYRGEQQRIHIFRKRTSDSRPPYTPFLASEGLGGAVVVTDTEWENYVATFQAATAAEQDWCAGLLQTTLPGDTSYSPPGSRHRGSQFEQDLYMMRNVYARMIVDGDTGFYVEAGANDAEEYSNTLFFDLCLGWNGLCIEFNPQYYVGLQSKRSCTLVPECISDTEKSMDFNLKGAGSQSLELKNIGTQGGSHGVFTATCRPLDAMLDRYADGRTHVDFWSLDVEGMEMAVLDAVTWERLTFGAILIETFWLSDREVDRFMTSKGLAKTAQMAIDSLYQPFQGGSWLPLSWGDIWKENAQFRANVRDQGLLNKEY